VYAKAYKVNFEPKQKVVKGPGKASLVKPVSSMPNNNNTGLTPGLVIVSAKFRTEIQRVTKHATK